MYNYFPQSYLASYATSSKARDALARNVMSSFERQGFSGYAVPAKYVSTVHLTDAWFCCFNFMFIKKYFFCLSVPSVIIDFTSVPYGAARCLPWRTVPDAV